MSFSTENDNCLCTSNFFFFFSGRLKSYAKVRVVSAYITKFGFKKNAHVIFQDNIPTCRAQFEKNILKICLVLKKYEHKTTQGKRIYKYTEK